MLQPPPPLPDLGLVLPAQRGGRQGQEHARVQEGGRLQPSSGLRKVRHNLTDELCTHTIPHVSVHTHTHTYTSLQIRKKIKQVLRGTMDLLTRGILEDSGDMTSCQSVSDGKGDL